MIGVAEQVLRDADLILWILDVSAPPTEADTHIAETLARPRGDTPVVLALNKIDQISGAADYSTHTALVEHIHVAPISALTGTNVPELIAYLLTKLPLGPRYYPADQVSEVNLRFIAAEVVREKIILNTEQEIPHSVAVEIDSFRERADNMTYISAVIYVEKESQKGIIIGKGGEMIKRIGTQARQELTPLLETRVYLDLRVKVLKDWRNDEALLRRLGYHLPKDSEER